MIVIDASVFNKLFLKETDSHLAVAMFRFVIEKDIERLAPNILLYETCSTALHYGVNFADIHSIINVQRTIRLTSDWRSVFKPLIRWCCSCCCN